MLRTAFVMVVVYFGTMATGETCPPDGIGYLPHETLCNSYYFCTTGAPNLRTCPGNLHWNHELRICAHPDSFHCLLRDLRCPEETDPMNLVFIPSELDCSSFSFCFNGASFPRTCGELYWDPITNGCTLPEMSSCVTTPTQPPPTTPIEVTCASDTGMFFMPHPNRCEFYFVCSEGTPHFRTCAPGLVFDAVNSWCDLEENSVCAGDPTTPGPSTTTTIDQPTTTTTEPSTVDTTATLPTTTVQPTTTTTPDVNDLPPNVCSGIVLANVPHPNPIFCNYYVFCFLQSASLRECRDGTIFSRTDLECLPGNVSTCTLK